MSIKDVWIVMTQSRPLPDCDINFDGCEYYFADAYVAAFEEGGVLAISQVLKQVQEALAVSGFDLVTVNFCARFSPEQWVDQTASADAIHMLAEKAKDSGYVVFSAFRSEEIQDLYHYHHSVRELESWV